MILRPYQQQIINQIRNHFSNGKKKIILCAPTGSGKTIMFSYMAVNSVAKDKRVLIITDRKELFGQAFGSLTSFGLNAEEIKPNNKPNFEANCFVAMSQTLKRRISDPMYLIFLMSIDVVIIDEAHKSEFDLLMPYFEHCFVIGATATPLREGKQESLEKFYDEIVQEIDTYELISDGFLSNCTSYSVPVNLKGVKTKGGDWDEKSMSDRFSEIKLFHGVKSNYERICKGQKAIIFAPSRLASIELVENWDNDNVRHVDCYMNDREDVIKWFKETPDAILSNYGILTTGFDCPDIDVVILYRATKSLPLFLQMVGRGSRTTNTKNSFTLLDFGNNIKTHNFWEEPRTWTLKKKEKKEGVAPIKECPECFFTMAARIMECSECGHEFENSEKEIEEQVMIELQKLNGSSIQELAKKSSIKELMQIQEAKNYKKSWIYHYLKTKDDFVEYGKIMKYNYKWAIRQYENRR